MSFYVTRWIGDPPIEQELRDRMRAEGLEPYSWANSPGDRYSAHRHSYDKVIYIVKGSITFGLPELSDSAELRSGDRLDLAAGVLHNAVVGSSGVHCLEGHH